jgi:hypothetical protein
MCLINLDVKYSNIKRNEIHCIFSIMNSANQALPTIASERIRECCNPISVLSYELITYQDDSAYIA